MIRILLTTSSPGPAALPARSSMQPLRPIQLLAQLLDSVLVLSRNATDSGATEERRKHSIDQLKAALAQFRTEVEDTGAPR